MPESRAHKEAKQRAAGNSGRTEVPLHGGGRLDVRTRKTATEIERSGNLAQLKAAADRLHASHAPRKVLQVPEKDMAKAREAMRSVGTKGTVKNIGGTKSTSVRRGR
jgi:hypothetical protein